LLQRLGINGDFAHAVAISIFFSPLESQRLNLGSRSEKYMTRIHQNVDEMLVRLTEESQGELELIRALGDAIRRVDEQLLRDVRNVTIQHEMRREAIVGELQTLATRLCALPARNAARATVAAIDQQPHTYEHPQVENVDNGTRGADWREAAQNINDDFEFSFNEPRH
jgi:hypothetical protein